MRRWWVRRFREWRPLAISTPQMLALQAVRRDPVAYVFRLAVVLRAVFPRRWWYRLTGDPVALILALPGDLMTRVLASMLTVPGTGADATTEIDPIEAIRAEQRRAVYGDKAPVGPSLATAAMTVRATYGDAWYYQPGRWATADGYAPFAVTWVEFAGVQALGARETLTVADGFAVAHAKDPRRVRAQLQQLAYPTDLVS